MLRLAVKSLLDAKIRFALTAGSVTVGVAFVVTAFVTADSLRSTFGNIAVQINTGRDFIVRGTLPFGEITEAIAPPVSADLLAQIEGLDGVDAAEGRFFVNGVVPVDGTGEPVVSQGPSAGTNWTEDESLSQFYLIQGDRPEGPGEFALDITSFASYDFKLGNDYPVVTPTGPRTLTLTGTMQFGYPDNAGAGAAFSLFDTAAAAEVLGFPGEFTQIAVRASSGASLDAVKEDIEALLPDNVEVITADTATEEFSGAFESFIGPFQTILLVFAFVVLFVSAFIISNTFNIVLGQRIRELSLLRAIGATPRQVLVSVLLESVFVGLAAVLIGLGLGMLGALGLRGLFSALGNSLPAGPLPLQSRTVVWATAVGLVVTVVASLIPALKASRLSPVAGLTDDPGYLGSGAGAVRGRGRGGVKHAWRPIVGGCLTAVGLAATAHGLFSDFSSAAPRLVSLGAGAAVVFIAVAVLSPLMARPVASTLALPLERVFGIAGRLARQNAVRSPRRTAATAISLTVGLALVAMVSIVGQSLKASFGERLRTAVDADFMITAGGRADAGLPETLAEDLRAADVGTVVGFASDRVLIRMKSQDGAPLENVSADAAGQDADATDAAENETNPAAENADANNENATADDDEIKIEIETQITATDVAYIEEVANLDVSAGSLDGFDPASGLLVSADAAAGDIGVGDVLELAFVSGDTVQVTVAAIYEQSAFWDNWIIDHALHDQVATSAFDDAVAVRTSISDPEEAREALAEVLTPYPQADLEDRQEFQATVESNLNTVLVVVNVLLGFALLIALVGIVNTLTLSVFERTGEIGLLRAVGMTRRQLRRMIRWEAATVALYGAVVGVTLGTAFGVAMAVAIPDDIISEVEVPVGQLAVFVAVATVFGLIAAVFPSYRASRMNVLRAISTL